MWVMQYFQSAESRVTKWSTSPWIGSLILLYNSPFQHWRLSLTIPIWLSSVWSHKCHLNHHSNAWNLWQEELLVVPLETSPGMTKWPQVMRERAKTDISWNARAFWCMFEDVLAYCKQSLRCSAEVGASSNGKRHLHKQTASLIFEHQFLQ